MAHQPCQPCQNSHTWVKTVKIGSAGKGVAAVFAPFLSEPNSSWSVDTNSQQAGHIQPQKESLFFHSINFFFPLQAYMEILSHPCCTQISYTSMGHFISGFLSCVLSFTDSGYQLVKAESEVQRFFHAPVFIQSVKF